MKDILTGIVLTIIAVLIVSFINASPNWERYYQKDSQNEQKATQQEQQTTDKYKPNNEEKQNTDGDIVLSDKIYINTSLIAPHMGEG